MFSVHAVFPAHRPAFYDLLIEMHRMRYRVFVEIFGWSLPQTDHSRRLEIDQFDHENAIYLLVLDGDRLIASSRLLPTTGPHLMADVFADLCRDAVPRGPNIWEWSRTCVDPRAHHTIRSASLKYKTIAGFELALQQGVDRYTMQIRAVDRERWLSRGIVAEVLGDPVLYDGDETLAMMLSVSEESLAFVRRQIDLPERVLQPPLRKPLSAAV